jgi:hypothetical protein
MDHTIQVPISATMNAEVSSATAEKQNKQRKAKAK